MILILICRYAWREEAPVESLPHPQRTDGLAVIGCSTCNADNGPDPDQTLDRQRSIGQRGIKCRSANEKCCWMQNHHSSRFDQRGDYRLTCKAANPSSLQARDQRAWGLPAQTLTTHTVWPSSRAELACCQQTDSPGWP